MWQSEFGVIHCLSYNFGATQCSSSSTACHESISEIFLVFSKSGSLYNEGMRPLLYSEMDAAKKKIGWVRKGDDIKYYRNAIK